MANVKLVAIDLDGTLLNDQKQLSPRNAEAVERVLAHGVMVALATARDCASIRLKVPLAVPGLYYIGSGGALVYQVTAGALIWARYLAPAQVAESVAYFKRYDHPIFLNTENDYWVDRYNERVQMIEERYNLQTEPLDKVSDALGPIMRVSLAAPATLLQQAAADVRVVLGNRINVSLASPDWLDLLAPDAGKGPALQMLQARLGIGPVQTMAIGDYDSDLSLFEQAEYRVAMGNAVASVKTAATYITASNNDDGVAEALQMILQDTVRTPSKGF